MAGICLVQTDSVSYKNVMPSEASQDVKFEIGHILFIDIVGYSKLLMHEQSEQLQRLKEIVRGTEQVRLAESEGKLLRLPTGDGGALVFRNSQEAPVLCAIEISRALRNHPELRVRMGIHSGPVNDIADLNEQANIAGAGINIAQRVMDCGDAGHILLSKHVAEDLEHFARWQPYLHELGECEVKHGRMISLVNLYDTEFGNAAFPQRCRSASATSRLWRGPLSRLAVLAASVLMLAGIAALLIMTGIVSIGRRPIPSGKSIAVLPFESLSADPENAYFADGIQEEILTRLSRIADLKVIGRTSTQKYRSAPPSLRNIGQQLGVAHVLEGSVQKAIGQVRVNVQLIRIDNESQVWAEKYDRKLTDVFAVETEIAAKIADTLNASLSGIEQRAIAYRPTEDAEAHELYLKGRYFWSKRSAEDLKRAIDYFGSAIARDPNYARAYTGIADCYTVLPAFSTLSPAEGQAKAREAVEKALTIDNDLAEAHASRAILLLSSSRFRDSAEQYLDAIKLDPNYATAYYWYGYTVLLPLGRFDEAIAQIKRALELDPLSTIINANLAEPTQWVDVTAMPLPRRRKRSN
jgi:TolB-like protein/Tfp pilus assembly protein PilF/class 3 adenylate cyclase